MAGKTTSVSASFPSYPSQKELSTTKSQRRGYDERDSLTDSTKDKGSSTSCFSCLWNALRNFLACIFPCFFKETSENPRQRMESKENKNLPQTVTPPPSSSSSYDGGAASSSSSSLSTQSSQTSVVAQKPSEAELFIEKHKANFGKDYKTVISDFKSRSREVQILILFQFIDMKSMSMKHIISYILVSEARSEIETSLQKNAICQTIKDLQESHRRRLRGEVLMPMGSSANLQQSSYDGGGEAGGIYSESSSSFSSSSVSTQSPNPLQDPVAEFRILFNKDPEATGLQDIFSNCKKDADKSDILRFLIQKHKDPIDISRFVLNDTHFFDKAIKKLGKKIAFITAVEEALQKDSSCLPEFLDFTG